MIRRSIRLGLVALAVASGAQAQAQAPSPEQYLAGRVVDYFAAMSRGDVATIATLLADDYTVVGVDGKFETRAERLSWLKANPGVVSGLTPSRIQVRLYRETAVVSGLVTIPADAKEPEIVERFTQVWVRRLGVWRIVSGQITKVLHPDVRP